VTARGNYQGKEPNLILVLTAHMGSNGNTEGPTA